MEKIKVVLDTNIVVSGAFWTGASFHIMQLIDKGEVFMVVSPSIIEEYYKILNSKEIFEKTNVSQEEVIKIIVKIMQKSFIVEPKEKFNVIRDDPEDNKFIDAAVAGNAEYIISNDNHLLNLKEFNNIKIIKPEQFLKQP